MRSFDDSRFEANAAFAVGYTETSLRTLRIRNIGD